MFKKFIGIAFAASLLAACAQGQKIDYSGRQFVATPVKEGQTIALGVQDNRAAIKSGEKSPDYVGKQRDGWGIPYDVRTSSGQPLASDVASMISNTLTRGGGKVTTTTLTSNMTEAQAKDALATSGAERRLYVTIQEWRSDSLMRTSIHYDITTKVMDQNNQLLAEKTERGEDAIDQAAMYNGGSAISSVFQRAIETMLRDPGLRAALQ